MKESTEELKAIIDNVPSYGRATHVDSDGDYIASGDRYDPVFGWVECACTIEMRSLSDIEEIIKLREFIAGLQLSVSDEVKANELLGVDDGY